MEAILWIGGIVGAVWAFWWWSEVYTARKHWSEAELRVIAQRLDAAERRLWERGVPPRAKPQENSRG